VSDHGRRICADTGGTFTDCIARGPAGEMRRAKVLSSGAIRIAVRPAGNATYDLLTEIDTLETLVGATATSPGTLQSPATIIGVEDDPPRVTLTSDLGPAATLELRTGEPAPVLAARLVTRTPYPQPIPCRELRLATTRGTNALLERRIVPVAFFVNEGFGDLLRIGDQRRSDLFALDIPTPSPLFSEVVEVHQRTSADGRILRPLNEEHIQAAAGDLVGRGIRHGAVALLHAWQDPRVEQQIAALLLDAGFTHVSCSSVLSPRMRIVPRARTAVVNAALSEDVGGFLRDVEAAASASSMRVMTSAGGLTDVQAYEPKDSLLSGPAGGVAGAMHAAARSGFEQIITFDMGGTSTDVARCDRDGGTTVSEHRVGDATLLASALAIESVAAGGGSICDWVNGEPQVGPRSAGASPGPACYGAGGPLTVTDVNLLLGRLDTSHFEIPIDGAAAEAASAKVAKRAGIDLQDTQHRDALLEGFLEIANERMAEAIRRISVRQGHNPAEHVLVGFGGAGAQHACAVAARLGTPRILVPADASLLSATGLHSAPLERVAERQVLRPLDTLSDTLPPLLAQLESDATDALCREGVRSGARRSAKRTLLLRYVGQDHTIEVDADGEVTRDFERRVQRIFGHVPHNRSIEVESVRVVVRFHEQSPEDERAGKATPRSFPGRARMRCASGWEEVPVHHKTQLAVGTTVVGPALITERRTTLVVEPGWRASRDEADAIVLTRLDARPGARSSARPVGIRRELLTGRFDAIAGEMGELLQRMALSTNVKERMDFSCALLDAAGNLVVSAPHVPVHLGALGLCVRTLMQRHRFEPGDLLITNHPGFGGSHLPDVTLVAPVCDAAGHRHAFVAARAHHAELGGVRPGSMSPEARTLAEEGVALPPLLVGKADRIDDTELRRRLTEAPFPSRAPEENLADVHAAIAALRRGQQLLLHAVAEFGADACEDAMDALADRAARRMSNALKRFGKHSATVLHTLDDGSPLKVRIDIERARARIDLSGSAAVHPGSLNAPLAVVRSVVLYVLRCLAGEDLPLNEGLMRPVELHVPPGMLNPPFDEDPLCCPAVAGGNVETSQRLTNALLQALGLCAGSQGTMNNLIFGRAAKADAPAFGYYETIGGGAGATPLADGASGVHTHMTNTAITDPEVIESRYPIRVDRFALRRGSGGHGTHRGGDGLIRALTFLEPLSLSMLTQHRTDGPAGLGDAAAGRPGSQTLIKADGTKTVLASTLAIDVDAGDTLVIETPGGGGFTA
jgi:5-oxoprolinase (ATP-hydrolysing)